MYSQKNEDLPLLVSVSGGKTSAFMAIYLKHRYPNRRMLFVFANTGREKEETLLFLDRLDHEFDLNLQWIEARVHPQKQIGTNYRKVCFETASRNGEPFEDVIQKYGLPSKLFRHCTRELKERPIKKFATEILGNHEVAIGIRADEKHRLRPKHGYVYPLAEMNIDKSFVNDWWSRQSFNLQLIEHEGNCDFCFLKSKRKRVMLLREGLDVEWWNTMEIKHSSMYQPFFDVRNQISISGLIELASTSDIKLAALNDIEFDCFCKST
ncbi:MAG: phosphoadenosine phosphosulfate reductase family protein [Bacteroidota bacterium]